MSQFKAQNCHKTAVANALCRWRIVWLLVVCAGMAALRLYGQDLSIVKGSSTKVNVADGIRKVTIGSDKIIDAQSQEDGRALRVIGLSEGYSDLRIERMQGPDLVFKVGVRPEYQETPLDQMRDMLFDVVGLKIKPIGNKILFDGKIDSQADFEKVKKVEAAYPGMVIDLVTFDVPEMAEAVKVAILKDLHSMGVDSVSVQVAGDTVVLDGVVNSDADMTRSIEKAKLHMANVKSLLRVQQSMIETDLQFVEVNHEDGSSFGENLFNNNIMVNPSFSAATTGRPGLGLVATATYKVSAALTTGKCKTIYQEHISGASGQEVDFKQGGTLYVPGLPAVPYGVVVKVKPSLQGKEGILSDVSVEISTAVWSQGQVTTKEFKTSASVMSKVGETVVLSGFAQALGTDSTDRTPILYDIPLLNLLFSNKSKSKSHKEAVLFLTPRPSLTEEANGPAFSAQSKRILNDAQSP